MSEPSLKKKRPERPLYVPPAQRASRLSSKAAATSKCLSDPVIFGLSDIVNFLYFLQNGFRTVTVLDHQSCHFYKFLQYKKFDKALNYSQFIKTYDCCQCVSNPYWNFSSIQNQTSTFVKSYPIFDFESLETTTNRPSVSDYFLYLHIQLISFIFYEIISNSSLKRFEVFSKAEFLAQSYNVISLGLVYNLCTRQFNVFYSQKREYVLKFRMKLY